MRQNCPVCFEYLFDSVRPTAVLPCGHTIHSECLKDMEKNRQLLCPICMKTYADLAPIWRRIDQEVADTPMPPDYANWIAHILCNDCNQVLSYSLPDPLAALIGRVEEGGFAALQLSNERSLSFQSVGT